MENSGEFDERELALLALADMARRNLEHRLDETGTVDFEQIIVRTRDLLQNAGVRASLRRKIRFLIIDEFQDVDPVQQQIAYLLGQPGDGDRLTTRLLIVGDPKQSIYRFRRADVTVWTKVKNDFDRWTDCLVIPLNENFRSTPAILGFVDHTVGALLDTSIDGETHQPYEIPFESLESRRADGDAAPVELLVVPATDDGKKRLAEDMRRIDADAVAKRARQLVDEDGLEWGDIALLMPGWGALDVYKQALEAVGAKTFPLLNEGFYERREVLDLVLALQVARDPSDDLALFGFLRSPFVGVKDETLLALNQRVEGRPYWYNLDGVQVAEQEVLDRGVEIVRRYSELRDRMPTDELLESLIDETGYLAHLKLQGDHRDQAIANVRKFLHLSRSMAQLGVGDFLRTIQEVRDREDREADAPMTAQKDAVTLTSIHSAKGLEWKAVFFCDTNRRNYADYSALLIGRDTMALKIPNVDTGDQPPRRQALQKLMLDEDLAEDKRVWYVAMTRAKERLFITGLPEWTQTKDGAMCPADFLWKRLCDVELRDGATFSYRSQGGAEYTGIVRMGDASVLAVETTTQLPEVLGPEVLGKPLEPLTVAAGRPRHSATELVTHNRCQQRHWFKYILGVREPPTYDKKKGELVDAITRGLIVHDVLERLREEEELDYLLEDAIQRHDADAPPREESRGQQYREHLRDEVQLVAQHPDYRAVADHPTARHELEFLHVVSESARFEGLIDLAATPGPGHSLLDVKTSQCNAEVARKKAKEYAPQRDVYVSAVEAISGTPVDRFAFQFSRAEEQISEDIPGTLRDEIRRRVQKTLEQIEFGTPELTRFPWECRFCGYNRVGWCKGVEQVRETGEGQDTPQQTSML